MRQPTMKNLLLVFFIIYVHTFCFTAGKFLGNENNLDVYALINAIENKCSTTGNPKQLENAFNELEHCVSRLERGFTERFDLTDYDQDHCSFIDNGQLIMCFKNLTKNMSPCLTENEIYIQQSILKVFDAFYEEFCGANGLSNKHYIYDRVNQTGDCLQISTMLIFYHGSCNTANLKIFEHLDEGEINFNKEDVCSDLKSLHKCSTQLTEAMCNEEFSRFMDLIFNPFMDNCNDLEARK